MGMGPVSGVGDLPRYRTNSPDPPGAPSDARERVPRLLTPHSPPHRPELSLQNTWGSSCRSYRRAPSRFSGTATPPVTPTTILCTITRPATTSATVISVTPAYCVAPSPDHFYLNHDLRLPLTCSTNHASIEHAPAPTPCVLGSPVSNTVACLVCLNPDRLTHSPSRPLVHLPRPPLTTNDTPFSRQRSLNPIAS